MQPPDVRDASLPSTIALVGASIRAAAQSAQRGGFSVLGADLFGDLDTLKACDRHELLDLRSQNEAFAKLFVNSPIATIPPIIRVGGLGNLCLDGEYRSLGPSLATIQGLQSPAVLSRLATESGLRFPRTVQNDPAHAQVTASGRWLRKTAHSSGGTGVTWHDQSSTRNHASIPNHGSTESEDHTPPHSMLQQWVAGRSYGATFFADSHAATLLSIFRSLFVRRGQHPFLYAGSFGPISLLPSSKHINDLASVQLALQRFGAIAAEHFQLRGLFNVDFIVDESGDGWVLEINPRWTAASELIERRLIELGSIDATDSLMRWHQLAHLETSRWRLKPEIERSITEDPNDRRATWIKQIVYADRPGMLDVRRLATITNRSAVDFADLPPPNRVHRRGDPLLTMIGKLGPNVCRQHDNCRTLETHPINQFRPSQWRQAIRETLRMIQAV